MAYVKLGAVVCGFLVVATAAQQAQAVVIYNGGQGAVQTTAPTDPTLQSAWNSIGLVDTGGAGTGNYYVGTAISPSTFITAQHIGGASTIKFGTKTYTVTASHPDAATDLIIYTVDTSNGGFSSYVPLYTGASEAGKSLFVAGRGVPLGATVTTTDWGSRTNGWKWGDPYATSASAPISWGSDTVAGISSDAQSRNYLAFVFTTSGCAVVNKDSGGPVFIQDTDSTWKLAGINYAVAPEYSTSATGSNSFNGAIFDSRNLYYLDSSSQWTLSSRSNTAQSVSYASRVSDRASWATQYVPEPTSLGLILCALLPLTRRHRSTDAP